MSLSEHETGRLIACKGVASRPLGHLSPCHFAAAVEAEMGSTSKQAPHMQRGAQHVQLQVSIPSSPAAEAGLETCRSGCFGRSLPHTQHE